MRISVNRNIFGVLYLLVWLCCWNGFVFGLLIFYDGLSWSV